ncbi:MAG: BACON domain-containing protein [Bacteroidaceae bacterium]|nr:BACON domain-containing protein [Bacteroidaceae bacterium]
MKKSLIKTLLCAISLLLVSCIGAWEKQVNFGFPETITFTKEGGERVYNGNNSFSSIRVYNPEPTDNDNDFSYGYCEKTGVHYEEDCWLRVEYGGILGDSFKLYVEPNTSGKPRQMKLTVDGDFEFQTITVRQEG